MASEQGGNPQALYSAPDYRDITSIASDIDLLDTTNGIGGMCRAIRCDAAGVLVVKNRAGTSRTLRFQAGETQYVNAKTLVASGSSGCVPITVYL